VIQPNSSSNYFNIYAGKYKNERLPEITLPDELLVDEVFYITYYLNLL